MHTTFAAMTHMYIYYIIHVYIYIYMCYTCVYLYIYYTYVYIYIYIYTHTYFCIPIWYFHCIPLQSLPGVAGLGPVERDWLAVRTPSTATAERAMWGMKSMGCHSDGKPPWFDWQIIYIWSIFNSFSRWFFPSMALMWSRYGQWWLMTDG